jgi:hypothetical protein
MYQKISKEQTKKLTKKAIQPVQIPVASFYNIGKLINCVEIISRLGIIIIKSTSLSNKFLH